jgi:hypothetical protein
LKGVEKREDKEWAGERMRREGMEGSDGREGERDLRMRRARLRLGQQGLPLLQ